MTQMNLLMKQKQTHRKRTYDGGAGGADKREGTVKGVWDQHVHAAIFKMDNQ